MGPEPKQCPGQLRGGGGLGQAQELETLASPGRGTHESKQRAAIAWAPTLGRAATCSGRVQRHKARPRPHEAAKCTM